MPWCKEKNDFLILDCWDNFEYFKLNPRGKQLLPQVPLPVRLFGLRVEKIEQALILGKPEIAEKESSKAKNQIAGLPANSVVVLDARHELQPLEDSNFWVNLTKDKIVFLKTTWPLPPTS